MQALSLSGPQELHDLAHLALIQVGFDVHCPSAAHLGHWLPLSVQPEDPSSIVLSSDCPLTCTLTLTLSTARFALSLPGAGM